MGNQPEPVEHVDEHEASVRYLVGGCWRVTLSAQHGLPWDGPESLSVTFAGNESADVSAADETNGISTAVLRAIPLADARVRLRRLRAGARVAPEVADVLRRRCVDPVDWARFAHAYAEVAKESRQPLVTMAEVSGVNRHTLAARAVKARELGFLTAPTDDNLGELTASAKQLIRRVHEQWAKAAPKNKTTERKN